MVIATDIILGWCGITTNANKNTIVAELLSPPEVLGHLNDETEEGMVATFCDFGRRDANDGKIIFSRVQQKRITSLMDWVKDRVRIDEPTDFEAGTDRAEFITQLEEASERKKCRTNQKKIGDSLITSSFQVQLETATQWDRWIVELESNLKMIIGSKGIGLSYIIRENDDPDLEERATWDLKATLGVPH